MWPRKQTATTAETPEPKTEVPTAPVVYPSGIAVRTPKGAYFINRDGKRYRIKSEEIMATWNFPLVVESSEEALADYPVAFSPLGFRDGALLLNIADGRMYLVSDSRLRQVIDPKVFKRLGVDVTDALLVSLADIKIMKMGEPIY